MQPVLAPPARESLAAEAVWCPIQQGLVDGDPDVDAIYRLVLDLPFQFTAGPSVALGPGAWCPFNSQNTSWWPEAYPLMYLPAYCSFRMTDIWRSFVAQRIAWENGWSVLFHEATVRQRRNPHDLLRDFRDEVPGYLANREICAALQALELEPGGLRVAANMRRSYELSVAHGWVDPQRASAPRRVARGRRYNRRRHRASGGLSIVRPAVACHDPSAADRDARRPRDSRLVLFVLPPGGDLAAHLYQRGFFIKNGFAFWNNYWYAGRYSFVTYSIGFYPLAALVGIKVVSLAAVAVSTTVFAIVLARQWGDAARWPIRAFAVVWPLILISGELPFLVGMACAISAILAVQARRFWLFTLLVLSTLLMSPLALLFLGCSRRGAAIANRDAWRRAVRFGVPVALCAGIEALLIVLFPSGGRFPFSFAELLPVVAFCAVGLAATWRLEQGKALAGFFAVYLVAISSRSGFRPPSARTSAGCATSRFPSHCWSALSGSGVPRGLTAVALVLVASWNLTPLAWGLDHNVNDPTSRPASGRPPSPNCEAASPPTIASKSSTPPGTGARSTSHAPGSRSHEAGTDRTTSPRTPFSTAR